MAIFYSASASGGRGGFYDSAIHGDAMPVDAVHVTARRHRELIEAQAAGRTIGGDAKGKPMIRPARKLPLDELRARAVARVKGEARRRILAIASLERQTNDNAILAIAALDAGGGIPMSADTIDARHRRLRIDAVRAASNAVEATIARMPTANLTSFDAAADRLWPSQE